MVILKSILVYRESASSGGGGAWGEITGTLSDQTDLQAALDLKSDLYLEFNTQTDDYTLVLTDKDTKEVRMNKATAINLTVPPNSSVAFPVGTQMLVKRIGAGALTFVQGAGVTITASSGGLGDAGQNVLMALIKTGTNTWDLENGSVAGGSGDVVGPASSVDSRMVEFDGITGKLIKDSGVVVSSFAKTILDDANAASARTTLELLNYPFRTTRFYSNELGGASTTTQLLSNGNLRAWLWRLESPMTITEIISEVTTFAGATSYRIAIYQNSGGYPGALVAGSDVTTYDSTANGVKTSGNVSIALTPGYYWIAFNSNGTPTLRAHAASNVPSLGTSSSLGSNAFFTCITVAQAYGSMPDPFTAGGTYLLAACPIAAFEV